MNTRQFIAQTQLQSTRLTRVAEICRQLLQTSPLAEEARAYAKSRASSHLQEKFDWGYFPSDANLSELLQFEPMEFWQATGLVYLLSIRDSLNTQFPKSLFSQHNLVWPIRDDYGFTIGMMGRTLLSEEERERRQLQKYKYNRFPKGTVLFGLDRAKKSIRREESAIIVEGQLDAMMCQTAGYHSVVALGGTSLSFFQLYLLRKHGAKKLRLCLDNDNPGRMAAEKIIKRYSKEIPISNILLPDPYKDAAQYLKESWDTSALLM